MATVDPWDPEYDLVLSPSGSTHDGYGGGGFKTIVQRPIDMCESLLGDITQDHYAVRPDPAERAPAEDRMVKDKPHVRNVKEFDIHSDDETADPLGGGDRWDDCGMARMGTPELTPYSSPSSLWNGGEAPSSPTFLRVERGVAGDDEADARGGADDCGMVDCGMGDSQGGFGWGTEGRGEGDAAAAFPDEGGAGGGDAEPAGEDEGGKAKKARGKGGKTVGKKPNKRKAKAKAVAVKKTVAFKESKASRRSQATRSKPSGDTGELLAQSRRGWRQESEQDRLSRMFADEGEREAKNETTFLRDAIADVSGCSAKNKTLSCVFQAASVKDGDGQSAVVPLTQDGVECDPPKGCSKRSANRASGGWCRLRVKDRSKFWALLCKAYNLTWSGEVGIQMFHPIGDDSKEARKRAWKLIYENFGMGIHRFGLHPLIGRGKQQQMMWAKALIDCTVDLGCWKP